MDKSTGSAYSSANCTFICAGVSYPFKANHPVLVIPNQTTSGSTTVPFRFHLPSMPSPDPLLLGLLLLPSSPPRRYTFNQKGNALIWTRGSGSWIARGCHRTVFVARPFTVQPCQNKYSRNPHSYQFIMCPERFDVISASKGGQEMRALCWQKVILSAPNNDSTDWLAEYPNTTRSGWWVGIWIE